MRKAIQYFIPSTVSAEAESQRKARLTVSTWFIIALFNLNYALISALIHYQGGILSQLPLFVITLICLFGYKYKLSSRVIYPFYFISCTISIAITVFYTGGFLSVLFSWLATTPIVAVLVWNKKGAIISILLVILVEVLFFLLYNNNYGFPNQILPEVQKVFYLTTNIGLSVILFWIAIVFENAKDHALNKLNTALQELQVEKHRSDELLLNILPEKVAQELKARGKASAHEFDHVTVIFTDFVGFTLAGERMTSQELVSELDHCFKSFDDIIDKYKIEKIKTVGDAYLAVSGLPNPSGNHAQNMIRAAIEIRDFMVARREYLGDNTFEVRIGIHSGSVVAGIVGIKKFAYDIWGDTVNTAARMEQNSEPGKINISETTYNLVKDQFSCDYRGEIEAKNKGKLRMYFVEPNDVLPEV